MRCKLAIYRQPAFCFDAYRVTITCKGQSLLKLVRTEWQLKEFLQQIAHSSATAKDVVAALREPHSRVEREIVLEDATWRLLIGEDKSGTLNAA